MSEAKIAGGWSGFQSPVPKEAMSVFTTATEGLMGVKYTPVAVAAQVVAGMNYCYLCTAIGVYPDAIGYAAKLNVYQPLPGQGIPHVTSINAITP